MSTETDNQLASVLDELKLDLISQNHVIENASKRKEIARTFICESLNQAISVCADTTIGIADTITGSHLSLSLVLRY
jgi:hypothetical protein